MSSDRWHALVWKCHPPLTPPGLPALPDPQRGRACTFHASAHFASFAQTIIERAAELTLLQVTGVEFRSGPGWDTVARPKIGTALCARGRSSHEHGQDDAAAILDTLLQT